MTRLLLLVGLCAGIIFGSSADSRSAQRKIEAIEEGRLLPGSTVLFTPAEINSWANDEARVTAPGSLRDIHLELGTGRIRATAQIEFESWSGPVTSVMRVESRDGRARVDVDRVEISGIALEGTPLRLLVRTLFPDAHIGEWFDLAAGVDHLAVTSRGIVVLIGHAATIAHR